MLPVTLDALYRECMANPPKRPASPTLDDFPNSMAWLHDIQRRDLEVATREERQAAITAARADGLNISQVASLMGMSRASLYKTGYDLDPPPKEEAG